MARPTHIPKFGNWDPNEHMPYTVVFDNARAGKGGKIINPNDPAENEALFRKPSGGADNEVGTKASPQHERRVSKEDAKYGLQIEGSQKVGARHARRPSRGNSEYGESDGIAARRGSSNSENGVGDSGHGNVGPGSSPLNTQYPGRLGKKLGSASPAAERRSDSGTPGTPNRNRQPEKYAAPLPKFGDWDVNNPASGEGFTVIFNKARDEKKTGGALRIPPMQGESPLRQEAQVHKPLPPVRKENSNWLSCCFHPSTAQ